MISGLSYRSYFWNDDGSRGRLASCRDFSRIFLSRGPQRERIAPDRVHRRYTSVRFPGCDSRAPIRTRERENERLVQARRMPECRIPEALRSKIRARSLQWWHRARRVASRRFDKHAHFSLSFTRTCSRFTESAVASRRRRSCDRVLRVRRSTMRRARTPTADWLLLAAVCCNPAAVSLPTISRLRVSSGAVSVAPTHYPPETWSYTFSAKPL